MSVMLIFILFVLILNFIIGNSKILKSLILLSLVVLATLLITYKIESHSRDSDAIVSETSSIENYNDEEYVDVLQEIKFSEESDDIESEDDFNQEAEMTFLGDFYCTGYTTSPEENGGYNTTYDGRLLSEVVHEAIAVDPSVIPIGKVVYIDGIGYRTARDIGGAIKGNRIDILVNTTNETYQCTGNYKVYILN